MIKVNLITVKRRKPIQIPFAAIFLVIALAGILAAFWAGTVWIETYNKDLEEKKKELEDEVRKDKNKLEQRDRLEQDKRNLEAQIEQLKQLSGANLLQWSEVFSSLSTVVPEKTVWITNLRIDSDRRVQLTGYSCSEKQDKPSPNLTKGIQDFIKQLQGHSYFEDVFLSMANKNIYEKAPVWRFDITCRVKRDVAK